MTTTPTRAPLKRLKDEGVPFGARLVFRLQYVWFLASTLVLMLSMPLVVLWALLHPSGIAFIRGSAGVIQARARQLDEHRARLIGLYRPESGA